MTRELDVYLYDDPVGLLVGGDDGEMTFQYAERWLETPGAAPLSQSLPLRPERFRRNECRGFFGGLLPEQDRREAVARNLGIGPPDDHAMLERIGGECPGAVMFLPRGQAIPDRHTAYRKLCNRELATILRELLRRPLLAGEPGVRLTLAGSQDKLPVRVEGEAIWLPLNGAPSTHILKPNVDRPEGAVFNEVFCMELAAASGLPAAAVELRKVGGLDFLLVERYDRHRRAMLDGSTAVERLHQEDFCQALGIAPEQKYQRKGGPSLPECFALVRSVSSAPVIDLARLLDAVIFNYLVGNHDAHGKSHALLYRGSGGDQRETHVAPLHGVVSGHSWLSSEMAMRIGEQCSSDTVTLSNFEQLAAEARLGKPLVRARLHEVAERAMAAMTKVPIRHPVAERVASAIRRRCKGA